jgi:hypothetical protein
VVKVLQMRPRLFSAKSCDDCGTRIWIGDEYAPIGCRILCSDCAKQAADLAIAYERMAEGVDPSD